jgi:hypothetical protein
MVLLLVRQPPQPLQTLTAANAVANVDALYAAIPAGSTRCWRYIIYMGRLL